MILYFPVVFPEWNICRKFNLLPWMYQKLLPEENWKNLSQTENFQDFWNFRPYYSEKLNVFPSKNHSAFLIIERYDIEVTISKFQIKILCLRMVPSLLKGEHFYYFKIWLILVQNAESAKKIQVENFMVYGNKHHSLTRKIGFRVISSFIHRSNRLQTLISFCKTKFFLTYSVPIWISKKFQNLGI